MVVGSGVICGAAGGGEKRGNASIGVPPFLFRGHPCLAHVVIVYHQEPVTPGEPEVTRTLSSS